MHERELDESKLQKKESRGVPSNATDLLRMLELYAPYLLKNKVA
jgi:hypothetical protein